MTGSAPFRAPSGAETLNAIINTPAPPLDSVDAALAPQLQRVLDGCLAKDASDRYPEMKALLSDLRLTKRDADSRASGVKPWAGPGKLGRCSLPGDLGRWLWPSAPPWPRSASIPTAYGSRLFPD